MTNEFALKLNGIEKSFSGVKVLHRIDFDVKEGEIIGLVGENGAGKSTLMNIIGGVICRDSGVMQVFGCDYNPVNPQSATEAGIAFIHQELNLFTNLTVAENMFIDSFPKKLNVAIDYKRINQSAKHSIDEYNLPVSPTDLIESLSAGIRQMIEISKGLMKNARIMIFDEPTTSLSLREKEKLFCTLKNLKKKGITIIYISHILEDIKELCDRVTVLRDGHIICTKDNAEFSQHQMITMMVGRELNQVYPKVEKNISDNIVFEAKDIQFKDKVKRVSFKIREGEILGLYGLMGAGRTELAKAIFGIEQFDSGEVIVCNRKLRKPTPQECIKNKMAMVTEDRHSEGLLLSKPVSDNLILVKLTDILGKLSVVKKAEEKKHTEFIINKLRIKVSDSKLQVAGSLSGGNQQKVVFGKWVIKNPAVFILDEPTRGVDVGAKFEIYTIIANMAKEGAAVFLISSEMEELIGTCDRIMVMKSGEIVGALEKSEFNQEVLAKMAL
jgi:ribose transport system ATP-binding protein